MSALGDKSINDRDRKRQFRQKASSNADWQQVDAATIQRCIATVAKTGGALRFGYSRDGGVFAVGVLGDGQPYTLWERDPEVMSETLQELCQHFEDMDVPAQESTRAKKRT